MAKNKKTNLDKFKLFYESAPVKTPSIPTVKNKRPGRKPKRPILPENILDNLE